MSSLNIAWVKFMNILARSVNILEWIHPGTAFGLKLYTGVEYLLTYRHDGENGENV